MDHMKELVDRLNQYRDAYYNQNESPVSDQEYDQLFDELAKLERETGIVYANSPTATVGYSAVSKLRKVPHNHPLLSLGKTTDIEEFASYFQGKPLSLMGKMDGLTASLLYRNGELISAGSRGNGEVGEDITHNARTFVNLPQRIPFAGELILDGECVIDYPTFREIIRQTQVLYPHWKKELQEFHDRQIECITGEVPGMRELIMELKSMGYGIYGLTNWSETVYKVIEK